MKKKSGSRTKSVLSRILNVRSWADWDRMKSFTLYLRDGIKRLFVPEKKQADETFDAAMQRLGISEDALALKKNALFRLTIIMLSVAVLVFFYMIYQLIFGSFMAAIVSVVVVMIALVLAFRYHFWYFQIKSRKLGCTFEQWYKQGLMGEKE